MNNVVKLPDPPRAAPTQTGIGEGGGGPTGGDGMDQRVRQLEADMSFIKGKLDDMPTKDWVTTRLIWVVVAIGAIGALIEAGGKLFP